MENTAKYLREQERIAKIAFKLFAETGYTKTPLSVIGNAAGVQKSLLQYYFPKKSKFIELFIQTSINVLLTHVENTSKAENEEEELTGFQLIERIYDIAYFEFWYITSCPSTEALRMDVMESRDNTQLVVQCVCDWIFAHMEDLDEDLKTQIYDAVTFCIGGGFEYACMKMAKNEAVDVDTIVKNAMDFMVTAMGFDASVFKIRKDISKEWLLRTADAVDALTFGA